MERLTYFLFLAFTWVISQFSLETDFHLGRMLGALAYALSGKYRSLVTRNLTIAFGEEKSRDEIRDLAREHFRTLGANLLSSIKISTMPQEAVDARVTIEHAGRMHAAFEGGRGVVMVISHIGNWELFAQLAHHLPGRKLSTIYQPLGNRLIDEHLVEARARGGVLPLSRKEGFTSAIRLLRENGLVGVLVDQHAGDGGIWAPLFGRLASTSPLAATMALNTEARLVPVAVYTDGPAHWRVVVSEPIDDTGLGKEELTAEINVALEHQIRVSPADWFWVHNRWKTPTPRFLLARYKRGIAYPRGFKPESLKPFRILIRSSNWLGDAVMSVPAVQAISRGRSDAQVTVLTREKLSGFWKAVDGVKDVISIGERDSVWSVAVKIRDRFDAAIIFPNSVSTALEAWLAGVPRRVGYPGKWRRRLLNQVYIEKPAEKPAPKPHQVFHYLNLAKWIGADVSHPSASTERPKALHARIGLCPGAEYGPAKRWLPERFAEVARQVSERRESEWILFGTATDAPVGEIIAAVLNGKCTNLIGKTSLDELITELSSCRLLLTNDTGTMHLAAFLKVPVVAIFGSTEPALTGPLGNGHRVIRHHVECSPCFLRECPIDFRCMKEVEVDEVVESVLRMLDA